MRSLKAGFLGIVAVSVTAAAQQPRTITAADYMRAAKFLAPNLEGTVVGGSVSPTWLPDGRFWYRNTTLAGPEIVVIDPATRKR